MNDVTLRATTTRDGNFAWLFLAGGRYATLELDDDGDVVALLADRIGERAFHARDAAEAWIVPNGGAGEALRRIHEFLDA